MGYQPRRQAIRLDFAGTEHDGLEVAVRPLPLSVLLDVSQATTSGDMAGLRQIMATFAYALESWNVEDEDGAPVPADLDGLMSQPPGLAMAVIQKWAESMMGGA